MKPGILLLRPRRPQVVLHQAPKLALFASSSSSAQSTTTTTQHAFQPRSQASSPPALSVLPTRTLLRSLLFTSMLSSPLRRPSLYLMKSIVDSSSPLLSPAKNPLVHFLLRKTIYHHFCAGENEAEVRQTVRGMKHLGLTGVILGSTRECVLKTDSSDFQVQSQESQQEILDQAVEEWKSANLQTLKMIGEGDFLNVKFTGAGPLAVEALANGNLTPPPTVQHAIHEICSTAAAQRSRLWIDAEQQIFQPAIDAWTIDLMRRFNRNGSPVVYNTIQAYLKAAAASVNNHLSLAAKEGWTLGIKLVRGAYIAHDTRSAIHDTKAATDQNYNSIVESLLCREYPSSSPESKSTPPLLPFPNTHLFVASHNAESVRRAASLSRARTQNSLPTIPVEMGQLQGMADEISCGLIAANRAAAQNGTPALGVFKALAWGPTQECLHFLLRRAVENESTLERTWETTRALRGEVRRRLSLF